MAQSSIGIGMIGFGTVGGGVAMLLRDHADLYARRVGATLELRRVLVRDRNKAVAMGLVAPEAVCTDVEEFFATPDIGIVVEAAGGLDPIGGLVRRALGSGRHVVTANKTLLAQEGPELFALARRHEVAIAFEASCAGGIPIITAMKFGLMANRIDGLYGILNGTCNYILTEMTQCSKTYDQALAEAQERGFAEADPALDVSGRDAAQKLAILASLAFGVQARGEQVWAEGIQGLELEDIRFGSELGYDIKLLAIAQRVGHDLSSPDDHDTLSLRVHPCFIHRTKPLAQVHGSFNAISVIGHAVGHTMYLGHGAGRMPTASAVVSDLLNVASGWYAHAFRRLNIWPDLHAPARLIDADDLESRFYIRLNARDVPGVMAKVSTILGDAGISLSALMQHESAAGQFVPVVITTHAARQGALLGALDQIEQLDVVQGRPVRVRILDIPEP